MSPDVSCAPPRCSGRRRARARSCFGCAPAPCAAPTCTWWTARPPAPRRPPAPGPRQVLLRVRACAVCRTDLHVVDGELPDPRLPLVVGHEIVGTVDRGA